MFKLHLRHTIAFLLALSLGARLSAAQERPVWPPPSDLPEGVLAEVDGEPIPETAFYARLAREERRRPAAEEALRQLLDTRLVEAAMAGRSVEVTDDDVTSKVAELARKIESASGGTTTLEGELRKSGVSLEQFRTQLRFLVGLERLARADFGIPEGEEVPEAKLNLWMTQLRESARIETEGLPPGLAARAGELEITDADLGRAVARILPPDELSRLLRSLVSEHLIDRAARQNEIRIDRADLEKEMAFRRGLYEASERYPGIPFEQFVQATQGAAPDQLLDSDSFREQVALKKITAAVTSPEARRSYFLEHSGRYGPLRKIQQILVSTRQRTLDEARARAREIRTKIEEGASFDALVPTASEGPNRLTGGNLGFVAPEGELDPVLIRAAFALEPGEVSAPVETADGVYLLRVTAIRPLPSFEEAQEIVLRDLARDWLRDAQRTAEVRPDWIFPRE